jgi:hypothetical protein
MVERSLLRPHDDSARNGGDMSLKGVFFFIPTHPPAGLHARIPFPLLD